MSPINKMCDSCGKPYSIKHMIACDSCDKWIHYRCTLLPAYMLSLYEKNAAKAGLPYECAKCVSIPKGLAKFDKFDKPAQAAREDKEEQFDKTHTQKGKETGRHKTDPGTGDVLETITLMLENLQGNLIGILTKNIEEKCAYELESLKAKLSLSEKELSDTKKQMKILKNKCEVQGAKVSQETQCDTDVIDKEVQCSVRCAEIGTQHDTYEAGYDIHLTKAIEGLTNKVTELQLAAAVSSNPSLPNKHMDIINKIPATPKVTNNDMGTNVPATPNTPQPVSDIVAPDIRLRNRYTPLLDNPPTLVLDETAEISKNTSAANLSPPRRNNNENARNVPGEDAQTPRVRAFRGHKDPLSNFYPADIYCEGILFKSAEHRYQYKKAMHHGDDRIAEKVLRAHNALEAMRLGEGVHKSDHWKRMALQVMRPTLMVKAQQVAIFRQALRDSGTSILVEATSDRYWGSGLNPPECRQTRPSNWPGENRLGHLLMEVRRAVQRNTPYTHSSAVIIADSHGNRIIPTALTGRQTTHKITAYTFREAEKAVVERKEETDLICLQVGTNDVRRESTETCIGRWVSLVNTIRDKQPNARVVIGTIPPLRDLTVSKKAHLVNIHIQAQFSQDDMVTFADNNSINYMQDPNMVFEKDGVHLKEIGFQRLADNLKRAVFRQL